MSDLQNSAEPGAYGVVPRETVTAMSGLEFLQAMLAGTLPAPPFSEVMQMRLAAAAPGMAAFEGQPGPQFRNPYGTLHAGWATTLLDSAMSCAVQTLLRPGQGQTTVELKVNCVRPVLPESGLVRAEGKVIHAGRQIATVDARLTDSAGKLLAHAVSTCMIFDADVRAS